MFSNLTIVGNLTRDVEMMYSNAGTAITKGAIAWTTGYGDKKKTNFIDFVIFGKVAEVVNQYCSKGSRVLLNGELQLEQWQGQNGQNMKKHSMLVNTVKLLSEKNSDNQQNIQTQPQPQQQNNGYQQGNYNQQNIPTIDIDEEDIPF